MAVCDVRSRFDLNQLFETISSINLISPIVFPKRQEKGMPVKRFRPVGAVNLVLAIVLSIVGAQVPAAETPAPAPAPTTARSVAPEAEICKGCHEKYVE